MLLRWTRSRTLLLLTACILARVSGAETTEGGRAASRPILAGCEMDYPPYCIVTEGARADGFSVELLRATTHAMGREINFKTGVWEELKRDLAEGRIQALPLVGRTPEREALYDFTFPYLTMHGAIVVRNDNTDIRGPEDLKGKDVAVLKGDNAEEYLNRARLGARIVPLPSFETALRELSAGKHDAVVIQKLVAFQLMKSARIENLKTVGKPIGDFSQSFCFAVRKGDRRLLASLNEGLAIVMADGTFRRLHTKWFAGLEALDRAKSRIVVGGDSDYPPYEFLDRNGQPAGLNVDLTRAIARQLGIDVDIQLAAWGKIRKGLETGDIDVVQGMFYSVERDQGFNFSPPHTVVAHTIVARKGSPVPAEMADLSGKSILVMAGDVMEDLAVEMGLGKQLVAVASQEEALSLLAAGKHDCALVATVPALYWIEKQGWRNLQLAEKPVLLAEYCYAVPHGNKSLLSQLTEGLAAVETTGELRKIRTRWLGPYEAQKTSVRAVARYVLAAILPLLALLLGSVLWSRSLRKQVVARTRELSLKSALLEAQSEAAPDGILAMDLEGRALMLNKRFVELWEIPGENQATKSERGVPELILSALRDPEEFHAKVEYLRGHPAEASHDEVELKDGKVFDRHSRPLTGSNGDFLGRVWYFRDITERKQAEEVLARESHHNQAYLRNASDGIHILDTDGTVLEVSDSFCKMLGYSREELMGANVSLWDAQWSPQQLKQNIGEMTAKQGQSSFETQHRRRDGSVLDVEITARPLELDRKPVLFNSARDITKRKQAEERLRKVSAYARSLIEASLDPLVTISPDGKITDVNAATAAVTGRRRTDLIGSDFSDYFTEPERAREGYRKVLADGEVRDYPLTIRHDSGRTTDVLYNASVYRDEAGQVQGIFAAARDVSERKRAEEALRESEAELKEAQRVAHVGSWRWVIETDTVSWSEELFRIAGRDPAGRAPNYLRDHAALYTPESLARLQSLVERAIRTGEPYEVDLELIRPDGTTRWVADTGEARRDAKGQIVGLHGTVEDVTEQRHLQGQLLHSQKLEAVGRLAGGIAHDFNNILTVIGGYNEMLTKTFPVGEPSHRQSTEIGLAARRAAALTRQLLTFSRKQVLEPKVLDLNTIVRDILELLSRLLGEDVEIVLNLQSGLGLVKADPGQIEQVIMNLAVNARDAMPQGGKLILETQDVALDENYQRAHPSVTAGPYVLLTASDTGCGMTPETVSHIFEPFFTTKEQGKGTGLGLSTVFGIVKQSGGEISVYSVPDEGTTFKIYLPRVSAEAGESKMPSSPTILRAHPGETVLMVEDDEAVARLTQSMLGALGYEVLAATRGEEALETAAHHPGPIHLLLTDVVMPGMRGPEVAKRLLALRPETHVVFMSGYAAELVLNHPAVQGTAVFLQKPFTSSTLGGKLREALDGVALPEQQGAGVHGGRKPLSILQMDDDKDILEITRFFLAEDGHRVVSCLDVEETVARYAEALARGERFDLVLLDLSIPGKKGGVEGMREILKLDPTAKIVACSGAGPSEIGRLENGFVGSVEKPLTSESLKAILHLL